jgi:hypothetical protein
MTEAVIATVFVVVAAIVGSILKPSEDQLRPLTPQASTGDDGHGHDAHHH